MSGSQEQESSGRGPISLQPWAPRREIAPEVSGDLNTVLTSRSNGSKGCYGGWSLTFPVGIPGEYYQFEVEVRWRDLLHGFESLAAEVFWEDANGKCLDWVPVRQVDEIPGWCRLTACFLNRGGADRLVVRLLLRWSPVGVVEWRRPTIVQVPPPPARTLRIAAAALPREGAPYSFSANRNRFMALAQRAGKAGVDLLCLPEKFLTEGMPRSLENMREHAITVPGPELEPFSALAHEFGMAMCVCVLEREYELFYNTAVLLDEQGGIAAKYRKVHLAYGEQWNGYTPGDTFVVGEIKTAQAKVGMNICKDSSTMEAARAEARLGAEILLLPIAGDNRADGPPERPKFNLPLWTTIQQMRALDNVVYLVAARNGGIGSGIFGPDGTVLAMNYGDTPIVYADVDLNERHRTWRGAPFKEVCWYDRREQVYGLLAGVLEPPSPWTNDEEMEVHE